MSPEVSAYRAESEVLFPPMTAFRMVEPFHLNCEDPLIPDTHPGYSHCRQLDKQHQRIKHVVFLEEVGPCLKYERSVFSSEPAKARPAPRPKLEIQDFKRIFVGPGTSTAEKAEVLDRLKKFFTKSKDETKAWIAKLSGKSLTNPAFCYRLTSLTHFSSKFVWFIDFVKLHGWQVHKKRGGLFFDGKEKDVAQGAVKALAELAEIEKL